MDIVTLLIVGALLLAIVIVAILLALVFRATPGREPGVAGRIERGTLLAVAGGALVIAVLSAVGLVVRTLALLSERSVTVPDMQIANATTPDFATMSDAITAAHYESVTVVVTGLPAGSRWWLAAQDAAPALAGIGLCLVVAWLCLRVRSGRPFTSGLTWAIGVSGLLIAFGGVGSQLFAAIARDEVVDHLGRQELTAGADAARPEGYEGFMGFSLSLDLAPLGWAIALAIVAGAFEIGQRLQRERDSLQRDTEGLI